MSTPGISLSSLFEVMPCAVSVGKLDSTHLLVVPSANRLEAPPPSSPSDGCHDLVSAASLGPLLHISDNIYAHPRLIEALALLVRRLSSLHAVFR